MSLIWLFVAAGLVCVIQSLLYRALGARCLRYERRFSKEHVYPGESLSMVEVLENRAIVPMPFVRVEARIPGALRFGAASVQSIKGGMYHQSVFLIGSKSRITRTHPVTPMSRGYYRAGTVSLQTGDLLGMGDASVTMDTGARVAVYPSLLPQADIPLPCRRFIGDMLVRRFIQPDPFLVSGIRPYRVGDAPRDVDWKASAKTGELHVRTYEYTSDPKLWVLINVQRDPHQWGNLEEYETGIIENGISLAATVCLRALEGGAEVGFAANTDLETTHEPAYIAPARTVRQGQKLLEIMSRLTLKRSLTFHAFLQTFEPTPHTDILILSCYLDKEMEREIARLRYYGAVVGFEQLSGGKRYEA